ncbi:FecR family protein [Mariniphaga anaerophila]|uniref:FecR family protein n=1 Tax=Mariniphaga anaerophila TaxID=1484053 RepID=A0A1M5EYL3_9BACT|nr:FecR family protein [Mariniphaga anaerophila]SHF84236.1 FecR family protein [Mariniphaga anaerophila]
MEKNYTNIDVLISKAISGNATPEEMHELEQWRSAADSNRVLYERTKKAWDRSEGYLSEEQLNQDKFQLTAEYSNYLSGKIKRISRQSFIYKIAAVLAFPVALGIGWHLFNGGEKQLQLSEQFCEISSPKGHVSKCILPDGTEVWINTGSSVVYNTASFNRGIREVELEGEAYFEVTSNKENPFVVVTSHANVKVTGTSFNVVAYSDSQEFETVLAEGNIELQFNAGNRESLDIKPGQRAVYYPANNDLKIQQVEADMFTSWRNGELLFKDATLNDLVKELERIYDIKFHLKPQTLGNFRFRGMFSYNNNLIEALEKIKKTSGIDYYIENKEVWLRKTN